jgi:hypothetical protein
MDGSDGLGISGSHHGKAERQDRPIEKSQQPGRNDCHTHGSIESMQTGTKSIHSKLEETIKNQLGNILASVSQWTQDLWKELNVKIEEMDLGLQTVTMFHDTWTKIIYKESERRSLTPGTKEPVSG